MAPIQDLMHFAVLAVPLAALCSFVVTGLAVRHARRRRWLAHPEERSSHTVPTPQVGGIGVCAVLLGGLTFLAIPQLRALVPGGDLGPTPAACSWLLATIAFGLALGLYDDLHPLAALPKLLAIFVLAALATAALWDLSTANGLRLIPWLIDAVSANPGATLSVCVVLAFVWICFFVNAFNFMDGVNGQSGVFGLNAVTWFLLIATRGITKGDPQAAVGTAHFLCLAPVWWLGVLLAGALIGFLPWNFPRARTFLGDCGSLPVGALLAVMLGALEAEGVANSIAGLVVLSPYIYDVTYTLVRRYLHGEKVWTAHRSHLYQRLLIATGWSHARLLAHNLLYWVIAGALGMWFQHLLLSSKNIDPTRLTRVHVLQAAFVFVALAWFLYGYTRTVWRAEAEHAARKTESAGSSEEPQEDKP